MARSIVKNMTRADSYESWKEAALAIDKRSGANNWKRREKSKLYDHVTIRSRLEALQEARESADNHALLFSLNEGIHGNLGGMGSAPLYQKAKFGTKKLIVDYVDEVISALEHLAKPRLKGISLKEKHDFFQRASLCFGRSAFMMSGSGSYLYFHIGVLKALWEQNLLPEVISGSSGGSLVAAVVGSHHNHDLAGVFRPLTSSDSDLSALLSSLMPAKQSRLKITHLREIVARLIPDLTFEQAFNRTGIQINISITPADAHQKSRLLNAITSPNVMLREAVLASCAIPGVYDPVTLAAKNVHDERVPYLPNRQWVDGSISDDLPMKRLSRLYGVNHFIVSQTNPIVLPFISAEKSRGVFATVSQTALKSFKDWGLAAGHLMQKPFNGDSSVHKILNSYMSVVSQTYTGDINILPSNQFLNPVKALTFRTEKEISEMIQEGERATWPQMEKIRLQTKISRTLNRIVKDTEDKVLKQVKRSAKKRVNSNLKVVNKG